MTVTLPAGPSQTAAVPPPAPAVRPGRRVRPQSGTRTLVSEADLRRGAGKAIYFTVLTVTAVLFGIIFFVPLYWMVTGALKSTQELIQPIPTLIPKSWHWETYSQAWNRLQIGHFLLNTAYYAIGGWLIQIIVDVAAAYALSKLKDRKSVV